jgi:hypothetical protein
MSEGSDHANEGQGRKYGQEYIVDKNEVVKDSSLGNVPRLVGSVSIDSVHDDSGGGVQSPNGNGDLPV